MASLLTILQGAGLSLGAAGKSLGEYQDRALQQQQVAQRERIAMEELALRRQALDQQERAQQQEVPLDFIPQAFRGSYQALAGPTGTVRIDKGLAPIYAAMQQRADEQAGRQQLHDLLINAQGRPAQLTGALAEGEDPEAAALLPRTESVPPMDRNTLAAKLVLEKVSPELAKFLLPEVAGDKYMDIGGMAFNPRTREWLSPPQGEGGPLSLTPPPGLPPNYRPSVSVTGNKTTTRWEPPAEITGNLRAIGEGITAEHGFEPGTREYKIMLGEAARYMATEAGIYGSLGPLRELADRLKREKAAAGTAPPPISGIQRTPDSVRDARAEAQQGVSDMAKGVTAAANAQAQAQQRYDQQQRGSPPLMPAPPKTPSPGEREAINVLDAGMAAVTRIRTSLNAATPQMAGTLGTPLKMGPQGTFARGKEFLFGTGMDYETRKWRGDVAGELQQMKKDLIGASRTKPELADLIPMVPDPDVDNWNQLLPKLDALYQRLEGQRASWENTLGGSRIQVPPRPKGAPYPGGDRPAPGSTGTGTADDYLKKKGYR